MAEAFFDEGLDENRIDLKIIYSLYLCQLRHYAVRLHALPEVSELSMKLPYLCPANAVGAELNKSYLLRPQSPVAFLQFKLCNSVNNNDSLLFRTSTEPMTSLGYTPRTSTDHTSMSESQPRQVNLNAPCWS